MIFSTTFRALVLAAAGYLGVVSSAAAACPNGPACTTSTNQCGGILVVWNPVSNADSYDVLRAPASNPGGLSLVQTNVSGLSFLDTSAPLGVAVVYAIQPRNFNIFSCPSSYGSIGPTSASAIRPVATTNMTVITTPFNGCNSFLVVTTDPAPFGGGVWRSLVNDFSTATRLGSVTSSGGGQAYITDAAAPVGVPLYYWARSEATCGNGPLSAVYQTTRSQADTTIASPTPVVNTGQECGQVTVTWATLPGWLYDVGINTGSFFGYVAATPPYVDTFSNPLQVHTYVIRAHNTQCGYMPDGPTVPGIPAAPGASTIATPPVSLSVLSGAPATMSATLTATASPTMLRWLREGQPVANSDRISGADTATLTISRTVWGDAGSYRLEVTNACGTGTSAAAVLAVRPGCRADFDESGGLAVADIFTFLNAWFAGCP